MTWDLGKVIVEENVDLPLNWISLSPSGRVFVEIGFGNGEFLEYLAKTYPEVLIVGIEVSQWCAAKGARRALAAGLGNVRIMHGDARFLLRHCFSPESVERVYMNFPCPWPKTRHASRRVTVPYFADLLAYLIAPGGYFELATDVDWYASEAAETISTSGVFEADPIEVDPKRPYLTKYERKWRTMGKSTWLLVLHKKDSCVDMTTEDNGWQMEMECESVMKLEDVLLKIKDAEGKGIGGRGHWVFRETFVSDSGVGLVLVITTDDCFEQHFYLKIIPGRTGFRIKVDSVGHPYRTPAMRAALHHAFAVAKG
ncbi:MAG: tRNA (guanosine(46)-N7)-methyltransferase TrmB [Synergistaceae bacterium]|nr:tRNA (guanosine(46)-N7)-methyltransferase TrmB [Synergistaceae bacterium]